MPERSRERFTRDPFAITPDPEVYVPRVATEAAREQLLRSACNPAQPSALIGPPGLGKTLLLQRLAREVPEDMQTVYLPYAALPPAELCAWALESLDVPTADDPIGALQAFGGDLRERGLSLLISIDDAAGLPIATARWVGEFVQNSGGSVRLALATSDNATGSRVIAAIGSNFDIVHLSDPMTERETRKYIDGRLALARAPDSIRARFDDRTVRLLHRISAGIPRRLHSAAAEVLQEAPAAAAAGERVEVPREVGERAAQDLVEPEPIARAEGEDHPISDRASAIASVPPRRAPSRRAIALGSLFVVFAAVAIPVIRSIVSEPRRTPAIEPRTSAARAEQPRIAEAPAVEPPLAESAEMLAVQINASPWANIEVDGIDLGATPLANIPLFAGEHAFRARMPDGRVIERTIEIDAERRFISFE